MKRKKPFVSTTSLKNLIKCGNPLPAIFYNHNWIFYFWKAICIWYTGDEVIVESSAHFSCNWYFASPPPRFLVSICFLIANYDDYSKPEDILLQSLPPLHDPFLDACHRAESLYMQVFLALPKQNVSICLIWEIVFGSGTTITFTFFEKKLGTLTYS